MPVAQRPLPEPRLDWALLLDFDGTLVDIAPTPALVTIPSDLKPLMERLQFALNGAVAIVSGRPIADIDRLLEPLRLPIAGQHGAEIRFPDGSRETLQGLGVLATILPAIAEFVAARPGLLLENKGLTVAVHYRLAPELRDELADFLFGAHAGCGSTLEIIAGNRVFELKPSTVDKGTALNRLMDRAPFAGRIPVFLGDDTTDEDGFAAALYREGQAIRVGASTTSLAPCRLPDPRGARIWLSGVADSLTAIDG